MEAALGDAVRETVGDKVSPSDAHEWAARGLWGGLFELQTTGAEALCACNLVVKVKVGVAATVGRGPPAKVPTSSWTLLVVICILQLVYKCATFERMHTTASPIPFSSTSWEPSPGLWLPAAFRHLRNK